MVSELFPYKIKVFLGLEKILDRLLVISAKGVKSFEILQEWKVSSTPSYFIYNFTRAGILGWK